MHLYGKNIGSKWVIEIIFPARERNLPLVTTGMFLGKWTSETSPNIELFFIYFGWWDVPWEIFFSKQRGCVLSLFQDDQDEVNQNYLADEEEEAEEEARVMVVPDLEEEEEEEEEKEEEEKEEEDSHSQETDSAWWQKLQIVNEYLWDPEKRTSLARTGQSWSKSQWSQCPSRVSFAFGLASRTPLPHVGWACLQTSLSSSRNWINA